MAELKHGPGRQMSDQIMKESDDQAKPPQATLAEIFQAKPANVAFTIAVETFQREGATPFIVIPAINLWCESEECDGFRMFEPFDGEWPVKETHIAEGIIQDFFCRNCTEGRKTYALLTKYNARTKNLAVVKVGEHPPLSLHIPSLLRKLVGKDQDKFNKGLQCEVRGLGVGAFAYYRQILENQKDRLIDEIVKVANLQRLPTDLIKELEQAKRQHQFSTAVEEIKHVIPEILLIDGHNPLTLLHKALSEGLHAGSDEQCLEIAHNIRVVLSEFSERLQVALKDNRELKTAVSRILNRPRNAGNPPPE
jgi:hypothetical protein